MTEARVCTVAAYVFSLYATRPTQMRRRASISSLGNRRHDLVDPVAAVICYQLELFKLERLELAERQQTCQKGAGGLLVGEIVNAVAGDVD